jgi:hypothetical protein
VAITSNRKIYSSLSPKNTTQPNEGAGLLAMTAVNSTPLSQASPLPQGMAFQA